MENLIRKQNKTKKNCDFDCNKKNDDDDCSIENLNVVFLFWIFFCSIQEAINTNGNKRIFFQSKMK